MRICERDQRRKDGRWRFEINGMNEDEEKNREKELEFSSN
jgi:hypothetical protein